MQFASSIMIMGETTIANLVPGIGCDLVGVDVSQAIDSQFVEVLSLPQGPPPFVDT